MTHSDTDYRGLAIFILLLSIAAALYFGIRFAEAGSFTSMSDTLTRQSVSVLSSHTIRMNLAVGNSWAAGETLIVDFDEDAGGFVVDGANTIAADFDITTVKSSVVTEANIVTSCGAGADDISFSIVDATGAITFTACGSFTSTDAASQIVVEYGTAASAGASGTNRVTNPGTGGSYNVFLAGTNGDSGTLSAPIVDSDQIAVTAIVDPVITFDLDTATTDTESATPYAVNLGTVNTSAVATSGTGGVNFIWVDIGHNGTGGAVITVASKNGSLKSTSVPADTIASSTATLSAGTAGYGLCVESVSQTQDGPLAKVSPFNSSCSSSSHSVGGLTVNPQTILNTTGNPIAGGRGKIDVKAAISTATRAHNDYTDQLSFICTVTY